MTINLPSSSGKIWLEIEKGSWLVSHKRKQWIKHAKLGLYWNRNKFLTERSKNYVHFTILVIPKNLLCVSFLGVFFLLFIQNIKVKGWTNAWASNHWCVRLSILYKSSTPNTKLYPNSGVCRSVWNSIVTAECLAMSTTFYFGECEDRSTWGCLQNIGAWYNTVSKI